MGGGVEGGMEGGVGGGGPGGEGLGGGETGRGAGGRLMTAHRRGGKRLVQRSSVDPQALGRCSVLEHRELP